MISILLPSRGRPANVRRLWESVEATTLDAWEMVVRLDDDDLEADDYPDLPGIVYLSGPRVVLSSYWNECCEAAAGPIFMQAGDDITIETPGWDRLVSSAFPPDGIALVHGDDGNPDRSRALDYGTHGFLRREWVEAVGYFLPPYFSSDFSDTWVNEVAEAIGRRIFVDILTEHHHPAFGKAPLDLTHEERIARHKADDCDAIYAAHAEDRLRDAEKLRAAMR